MPAVVVKLQNLLARAGFAFRAQESRSSPLFSEQAVYPWLTWFGTLSDPDEILLKAGVTRTGLRALSGDDEITAAMDTRREALLGIPWRLGEKAKEDVALAEPVEWLWEQLEEVLDVTLRGAMEALPYGYSVLEVVYKRMDDGRMTWAEVSEKPFEWFIPKCDGTVLFKSRTAPMGEATDPRKFFLTARNQSYRNPYGEALYSRLYWPWFFRQQGWRFWCRWLERFGTPLLIGETSGDAANMAKQLSKAVSDAAVAVGGGDKVTMAEQKGGAGHFEGFERAICARIQKLILGQTLTTDSGGSSGSSGSYALGKVHNEVREDRRNADVRMVTRTVQKMVDTLWELNGFEGDAPDFVMADDTGLEMDRAERDARLAEAGVTGFTPGYLVRTYDYEPEDLTPPQGSGGQPGGAGGDSPDPPGNPPPGRGKRPAGTPGNGPQSDSQEASAMGVHGTGVLPFSGPRFTRQQQKVEDGVAACLASLEGLPVGLTDDEIKAAIKAARNPAELVDNLAALLAGVNASDFRTVVERALFAADILGYAHARDPATLPNPEG